MTTQNETPAEETPSAYDLLSKPTLEISDAEAEIIIADLRKRRRAYVSKGTKDTPAKAPAKSKPTKADATAAIAASMNLDFDL